MKTIITIGISLILIGGVFCGAAYAFGEKYADSLLENYSDSFDSETVKNINISESAVNINFYKSNASSDNIDKNNILVQAENINLSGFDCKLSDDTLQISYDSNYIKFGFVSLPSFVFSRDKASPKINIYLPESKIFDSVNFKSNVGNINIDILNCKSLKISGGAGNTNIKNISAENLKYDGGMGNTDINGTVSGNISINGGAGNLTLSGKSGGDIKIDGGIGNIKIDLSGNIDDYNITSGGHIGSIKINGKDSKNFSSESSSGKYDLKIDGGIGNININIK